MELQGSKEVVVAATAANQDEPTFGCSVMDEYFDLFNSQRYRMHFAENSVVDWFGRQVKGVDKINEFLRYAVWSRYEHRRLGEPEECEPFETKPSHFATRLNGKGKGKGDFTYMSGLKALKTYAESEDESDEELNLEQSGGFKTPEKTIILNEATMELLTPPPSAMKDSDEASQDEEEEDGDDDEEDEDDDDELGQDSSSDSESEAEETLDNNKPNLKRVHKRSFSYLRHFPRKIRKHDNDVVTKTCNEDEEEFATLDSSSDDSDAELGKDGQGKGAELEYGPLQYIQATTILEKKPENPSVGGDSPMFEGWEKQVLISLSYRRHLKDNSLQFALVLYEHMDSNGQVQRNLKHLKRRLFEELNYEDDNAKGGDETDEDKHTKAAETPAAVDATNEITSITNEISLSESPLRRSNSASSLEEDGTSSSSTLVNVSDRSSDTASLTSIEDDSLPGMNSVIDARNASYSNNSIPIFFGRRTSSTTPNISSVQLISPTHTASHYTLDPLDTAHMDPLRTPTKLNAPPATPKRKKPKSVPITVLKRLQESPLAVRPPPKRTAARCLRL